MKYKKILTSVASAALFGASILPTNVFANNGFGIQYEGGTELSKDNVTIDPGLVSTLTPLMQSREDISVKVSGTGWKSGYAHRTDNDACYPVRYFKLPKDGIKNSDLGVSFSSSEYRADVKINSAEVENVEDELDGGKGFSVSVIEEQAQASSFIFSGHAIYSDSTCATRVSDIVGLSKEKDNRTFVSMNVKLHKKDSNAEFTARDIYFGITDIDAGQSYKILNPNNQLSKDNMFAESERVLQYDSNNEGKCKIDNEACTDYKNPDGLRNRFVSNENGSYIYSDYNTNPAEGHAHVVASPEAANVLVKLQEETQEQGLNVVFGYSGAAGSGIEYYAQQYDVTYASDDNGKISEDAIESERLISGDTASGSETDPKEGYVFDHWIADVDVTLTDGKTIKAGDPITEEEVKKVVVDKNIKFTAIHVEESEEPEEEPEEDSGVIATPDTGASTKNLSAVLVPASIVTILLGALSIRALPRLMHKKVSFKK